MSLKSEEDKEIVEIRNNITYNRTFTFHHTLLYKFQHIVF